MTATCEPGTAQAADLGAHELILLLYSSVSAHSDDIAVLDEDGTNGNSAFLKSLKHFIYCSLHEDVHGISIHHIFCLIKYLSKSCSSKQKKPIVLTSQAAPEVPDAY